MNAWGPLAEELGVGFAVYVASEGKPDSFPLDAWREVLAPHELHLRLRPYIGMGMARTAEHDALKANLSTLQTIGNMMDADVLLCDGKSLFSLAANVYGLGNVMLTYPWLLNMGDPLDQVIRMKRGDIDTPLNDTHIVGWPMHPAYLELRKKHAQGWHHPGVQFLR